MVSRTAGLRPLTGRQCRPGPGVWLCSGQCCRGVRVAPQLMPSYFAPPPSRASGEATEIPAGAASFAVHFAMPDQPYPSYTYDILDAAGKRESAAFEGACDPGTRAGHAGSRRRLAPRGAHSGDSR